MTYENHLRAVLQTLRKTDLVANKIVNADTMLEVQNLLNDTIPTNQNEDMFRRGVKQMYYSFTANTRANKTVVDNLHNPLMLIININHIVHMLDIATIVTVKFAPNVGPFGTYTVSGNRSRERNVDIKTRKNRSNESRESRKTNSKPSYRNIVKRSVEMAETKQYIPSNKPKQIEKTLSAATIEAAYENALTDICNKETAAGYPLGCWD